MKKLFKDASGWLLIIATLLLASCEGMYQEEEEGFIPTKEFVYDTAYVPAKIQYSIPNNDREAFGGSPDRWAGGIKTDSIKFLFTEAERHVSESKRHGHTQPG